MLIQLQVTTKVRPGPMQTWEAAIFLTHEGFTLVENFVEGLSSESVANLVAQSLGDELRTQGSAGLLRTLRGNPILHRARVRWIFVPPIPTKD